MGEDWFTCENCNGPSSDYRGKHSCRCMSSYCDGCAAEFGKKYGWKHWEQSPHEECKDVDCRKRHENIRNVKVYQKKNEKL